MKRTILFAVIAAIALGGCGSADKTEVEQAEGADEEKGVEDAEQGKAEKAADKGSGKAEVKPAGPRPVTPTAQKLSASHILLAYKGAKRARPTVERTKEEAEKLATELAQKIKQGADFAALAAEHSDCPSGKRKGGDLGIFPSNRMAPEFSEGVLALEVGETSDPVETDFGFHVIKRQKVEELHARHILIMHDESKRKPPSIKRTKEEARKLIEDVAAKLEAGEDFAALARELSDCPSGKRAGGDLGTFPKGRMAPPFEKATLALKPHEVSGIVETDFGFHIIERLP
jgi:peptidyl-prolyl cis-trans isomerase SurA